jgi:hypothetical protein
MSGTLRAPPDEQAMFPPPADAGFDLEAIGQIVRDVTAQAEGRLGDGREAWSRPPAGLIETVAERLGLSPRAAADMTERYAARTGTMDPARLTLNAAGQVGANVVDTARDLGAGMWRGLAAVLPDGAVRRFAEDAGARGPSTMFPALEGAGDVEDVATGFAEALMTFGLLRGMGAGNIAAGAGTDFTAIPEFGGVVSLLRDFGVGTELLEALDSRPEDEADVVQRLRARLTQVGEGGAIAGAFEAVPRIVRALREAPAPVRRAVRNAAAATAGAAALGAGEGDPPALGGIAP